LRLSRRTFLAGAGVAAAAAAVAGGRAALAQRPVGSSTAASVEIRSRPLRHFSVADRSRRQFGRLTFRSGLVLDSAAQAFGGFSGLWRSADGGELVAIADNAQWLTASIDTDDDGSLSGLSRAVMAPILGADGRPLRRTRYYDTEGLAIVGGTAFVSTERTHAVMRFDWSRRGVLSHGQLVGIPRETERLPDNGGLEAIDAAPPNSALAGALVGIAERSRSGDDAPTAGFILTGAQRGAFMVARAGNYDVTDISFLPSGELLVLERRFSLFGGLSARIRLIRANAVRPGALVDGPVIFESDPSQEIDNMEGMSLHRDAGRTIVTLISDDNFRSFQRTLLLEFVLDL
jgi:hypothetical protein